MSRKIATLVAVLASIFLLAAVWGIYEIKGGQDQIIERMGTTAAGSDVFGMDYPGEDGITHHVSVESELGETPAHLAQRFKEAVDAMKKEYPQRR